MSIIHTQPDVLPRLDPHERRRLRLLVTVASDLALGTTDIVDLKAKLADDVDVPPATNLVKSSADPISHANVSAARALGFIVPGP